MELLIAPRFIAVVLADGASTAKSSMQRPLSFTRIALGTEKGREHNLLLSRRASALFSQVLRSMCLRTRRPDTVLDLA
jgi:hypothetical protein